MAKIVMHEYAYDLYYPSFDQMTDNELLNFCELNHELLIERDEEHRLLIFPPRFPYISMLNAHLTFGIGLWNRKNKAGLAFDSSAGFFLPDTSMRSPDVAWISNERWEALSEEKRKGFAYITPNFMVELASPSDNLHDLKIKMEKWRDNGVQLGWLIDAASETVFIYRSDGTISKLEGFDKKLSGENILKEFEFELSVLR